MAASAILNLYLTILDHPQSSLKDLKLHRKFGVNRSFTFEDIVIFIFFQILLKTPIGAPKFTFLGNLTP